MGNYQRLSGGQIFDAATTDASSGNTSFPANVSVAGTLDVTGDTTLAGTLAMSAAAPTVNASAPTTYLRKYQNAGANVVAMDLGGNMVPANVNPPNYYAAIDWELNLNAGAYNQQGNVIIGVINSVTAALCTANNLGVSYVHTSSATVGGYLCTPSAYPIVKSSAIAYQWRSLFYLPAASSGANRYTAYIGAFNGIGIANNANAGPNGGPYIAYSDNLNSGNWVLGSAVVGVRTTSNSSTAATAGWHRLTITLANGVYTFVLDGVTIGTVTDNNMLTTVQDQQTASVGGIMIIPDGSNFTTQRTLVVDRNDVWITGLSR